VSYGEQAGLSHDEVWKRMPNKLRQILPGAPTSDQYEVVRFSPYTRHQRCAGRMRIGRIMLAADVAHLCNPMYAKAISLPEVYSLLTALGVALASPLESLTLEAWSTVSTAYMTVRQPWIFLISMTGSGVISFTPLQTRSLLLTWNVCKKIRTRQLTVHIKIRSSAYLLQPRRIPKFLNGFKK
jgi:hypothetical protein